MPLLLFLLAALGRAAPAAPEDPDYYTRLFEDCKKKGSVSCCMASVRRMKDNGFKLFEKSCPKGSVKDTLNCEDSNAWCKPTEEAPRPAVKPAGKKVRGPITRQKAVALAKKAIEKDVSCPPDTPIEVENKGSRVVVTFKTRLPPGTRGPDYHARVTLDAATGRVLQVLGNQD